MVFRRLRRSSATTTATTSSSNNKNNNKNQSNKNRNRRASTGSTSSSADLRRSSFGLANPVANWRARRHTAVTYRPAIYTLNSDTDYVMMLPGRHVQNLEPSKPEDSLNGWKGVSFFGDSGRVEYEPN